jgi:hypothetical protein
VSYSLGKNDLLLYNIKGWSHLKPI